MSLQEGIIRVLTDAQSNLHHHQKLLKSLRSLHDKHDVEEFFSTFFPPFSNVLLVYKKEPAAERVINFVAQFAALVAPKAPERKRNILCRICQ